METRKIMRVQPKISPIRAEIVQQSVKSIGYVEYALMACRVQFWDALNNPVANSAFDIIETDEAHKRPGGSTDANGEANIEFYMNVITEVRKKIGFVFNRSGNPGCELFFMLKDDNNQRMQKTIDEMQLKKAFEEDLRILLLNFENNRLLDTFIIKYEARVDAAALTSILEKIKQKRKAAKIAREEKEKKEAQERERLLIEARYEEARLEAEREESRRREMEAVEDRERIERENREFTENLIGAGLSILIGAGDILMGRKPRKM